MSILADGEFPNPASVNWLCDCGGQMQVMDSRPTTFLASHGIRRRRRCKKCGVRTTTIEITRDNPLFDTLERAQGIVGSSAALSTKLRDLAGDIDEVVRTALRGAAP